MNLSQEQIKNISAILSTKKGVLNKQRDYTLGALDELIKGRNLKPLHIGKPMNKLYQYAIDILNIIGVEVVLVGSMEDWISMKSYDVYYNVKSPEMVRFDVVSLLECCGIAYDKEFLRCALMVVSLSD